MNREIKFRVWDGQMAKMHNDVFVASNLNMRFHQIFLHRAYSDFHWMQWTGLVDKNGNEIYESDILSCNLVERKDSEFPMSSIDIIVKWDNEKAGFNVVGEIGENSIVKGNIYENPDLIKE